jgi:hypothetical protein
MFPIPAVLFASLLFGAVGVGAFVYCRKMVQYEPMINGFILMS